MMPTSFPAVHDRDLVNVPGRQPGQDLVPVGLRGHGLELIPRGHDLADGRRRPSLPGRRLDVLQADDALQVAAEIGDQEDAALLGEDVFVHQPLDG